MHVLLLGPHPPPEGGINRNTLAIREELLAAGHRCSIVATSRSTQINKEEHVHHPRTPLEFLRLLRGIKCDIAHLHIGGDINTRVLGLAWLTTLLARGRKVLSFHSGGYPTTPEGKAAKPWSVCGLIFRGFERIIAVNPLIAVVFERYGIERKKITVIPPFVHRLPEPNVELRADLQQFVDDRRPLLITVGLLEDEYDLELQVDAMESVLAKFPTAGLLIVGSGSLETHLRTVIAAKPYADRVLLAGDVEHRQTLHLVHRANVLLRTTLFDGDAISVREALFLGTPVVATDNGLRPPGVDLIPVHDQPALTEMTCTVLGQARNRITPTAHDNSNISAVLDVYRKLLTRPA
ncbi:MAG: glycosyltransferase family 4 protein [Pyrinomonadaceae bacterium]